MRKTVLLTSLFTLMIMVLTADGAGGLVGLVRLKLSAGDLAGTVSAIEEVIEAEELYRIGQAHWHRSRAARFPTESEEAGRL